APGAKLREDELAQLVGCSRTPVREALRRLAAEGLLELVPNRGAHMASWTASDLDEIFDLRVLLEGYAARRAAQSISTSQVRRLKALQEEMENSAAELGPSSFDRITDLNLEFHQTIVSAADSRRLNVALESIVQIA